MTRRVLCVHSDAEVRSRLVATADEHGFPTTGAPTLEAGADAHGQEPFDVVLAELDEAAAVVRTVRSWHPIPAIVTVGDGLDEAVDIALASGAIDHVDHRAEAQEIARTIDRSWRRHRAARTKWASAPEAPDLHDVRQRVAQLVSLTAAARELLGVDEAPHTTVRSLLEQATELGQETVHIAGQPAVGEERQELDLAALVEAAWGARQPRGTGLSVDIEDVVVHGLPGMIRTSFVVLFAHALRGPTRATRVHVDTRVLPDAVRIRVHDDGPAVSVAERRSVFLGGTHHAHPMLMTVQHVAARHGGVAWLQDSDVLDGVAAVLELPRRATRR